MKLFPISLRLFAGVALAAAAICAQAQVYPTEARYIPTAQLATTTFTATGDYTFVTQGLGTVSVRVVKGGSATYTAAIQGTNDTLAATSPTWTTLSATPVAGGASVTSITTSGFWTVSAVGLTKVRVHITAVGGTGGLVVGAAGTPGNNAVTVGGTSTVSGTVAIDQTTPGTTNAVQAIAGTTGGGSMAHVNSAASTNSTSVKGAAGTVYSIVAANTNAATAYLKFYDKATPPTCNSDTVSLTVTLTQNVPRTIDIPVGAAFAAGIGLCITGAAADNDNTNATTGVVVNVVYK